MRPLDTPRDGLKYFTRSWYEGEDDAEPGMAVAAYWRHVEEIADRLPPQVRSLALKVNLHDGRFRAATLRSPSGVLEMHLRCGDLQVGYFDLDLTYRSVNLSEAEVAELAAAVNLPETEVLYDEVDLGPEGSFVHRLLLWPRGELVIPFADLALRRRPTRSRRFRAPTPRFNAVPTRA